VLVLLTIAIDDDDDGTVSFCSCANVMGDAVASFPLAAEEADTVAFFPLATAEEEDALAFFTTISFTPT
jgi:hypothetical protein